MIILVCKNALVSSNNMTVMKQINIFLAAFCLYVLKHHMESKQECIKLSLKCPKVIHLMETPINYLPLYIQFEDSESPVG